MAVPVISKDYKVLCPTTERRARILMEKGEAKPFWRKGDFCILLTKLESDKREEHKDAVVIGGKVLEIGSYISINSK